MPQARNWGCLPAADSTKHRSSGLCELGCTIPLPLLRECFRRTHVSICLSIYLWCIHTDMDVTRSFWSNRCWLCSYWRQAESCTGSWSSSHSLRFLLQLHPLSWQTSHGCTGWVSGFSLLQLHPTCTSPWRVQDQEIYSSPVHSTQLLPLTPVQK